MKTAFSFRYKLLIAFLIISTIPLLIVSVIVISESSETLEKNIIESNLDFVEQAGNNAGQVLSRINDLALFIFQDRDVYALLHLPQDADNDEADRLTLKIYRTLMFFMNWEAGIASLYIEGNNGLKFSINPYTLNLDILSGDDLKILDEKDGDALWTKVSPGYIAQSRIVRDFYNLDEVLGRVTIQLRTDQILKGLSGDGEERENSFCIISGDDLILMNSGIVSESIRNEMLPEIRFSNLKTGYFFEERGREEYLTFFYVTPASEMTLFWSIPSIKPGLYELIVDQLIIVTAVMIVISIVMAFMFSRNFFIPLHALSRAMEQLESEKFSIRIPRKRNDEIGSLIQSFNNMAERLDELHNEVYVAQVKEKEAELIALETQINPHFLYNTLDTIYWMTKLEGSHESAKMIKTLSGLFRIALSSGKEKIPLNKEIEHLTYYMEIQTRRFENRFSYRLSIDPKLQSALDRRSVLKLILQPLVENAIIHGIEKKEDSSSLSVSLSISDDDVLVYEIEDDGSGFDVDKAFEGGFGLKNVDERLRLEYGSEFGLSIESRIGRGTKITVRQPPKGKKDESPVG